MKELFIKCPSCGAVLQVKNSKNEAVKQIVCPNCKHRLAVSFEETPQESAVVPQPFGSLYYGEMPIPLQEGINKTQFPGSQHVELNVVRLADGGSKCIIKAIGAEKTVTVNGETLQKDDQVVLVKGDKLEIGHVLLCYDKPCSLSDDEKKSDETSSTILPPPSSSHKYNNWLLYVVGGLITFALIVFLMWPKSKKSQVTKTGNDVTVVETNKKEQQKPKDAVVKGNIGDENQVKDETPKIQSYHTMSDYELERLASHGEVKAQYEYGKRLVNKGGSNNIILGLNYLKMAYENGSADAGRAWQKHVNQIQRRAEQGDSVAYDILTKID